MTTARLPAVSGSFYPADALELRNMISSFLSRAQVSGIPSGARVIGGIVPHAGYVYSGQTAAYFFSIIRDIPDRKFLLLGPNHASYPPEVSLYPGEEWITPLGTAGIDRPLYDSLAGARNLRVEFNERAHLREHSVEVEIPFLQSLFDGDFSFAPAIMGDQRIETASALAESILKSRNMPIVIASSDLTHYEPLGVANEKDRALLDSIASLDVRRFYRTLFDKMITACGYGPIAVLMGITKALNGRILPLHYSTSFEASGDSSSVVGYSSVIAYTGGD